MTTDRIRIFHRPARIVVRGEVLGDDDWDDVEHRLPEIEVVFEKQSGWHPWAKRGGGPSGRARVIDLYTLIVDERPKAHGTRRFVMQEAHREALLNVDGELPYWMTRPTKREQKRALRATQRHNDRRWHRKSNRRKRKAGRRWMRRMLVPKLVNGILRDVFRDAVYPKLLERFEVVPVGDYRKPDWKPPAPPPGWKSPHER